MSYYRMCKSEIKASRAFLKGRLTEWIGYKNSDTQTIYYYLTQNKAGFLRDLKKVGEKVQGKNHQFKLSKRV